MKQRKDPKALNAMGIRLSRGGHPVKPDRSPQQPHSRGERISSWAFSGLQFAWLPSVYDSHAKAAMCNELGWQR
jgi:hypothetical protein